jgi:hypothetical protein
MEDDTATNAVATATRVAPDGGLSHFITGVFASFNSTASGIQLTLKDGSTEVGR